MANKIIITSNEETKFYPAKYYGRSSGLCPYWLLSELGDKKVHTGNTFHLNYAFHDGMFKYSAGKDFSDQIRYGYDQGFRAIEDNGMMDRSAQEQEK